MADCTGAGCSDNFEAITNPEVLIISGPYKTFIEATAFIIFTGGVTINTGILTVLISVYPKLTSFDYLFMNLIFGELVSSFGLAFIFFVEFTTSIAPIGNGGCAFIKWLNMTCFFVTIMLILMLLLNLHNHIVNKNTHNYSKPKLTLFLVLPWLVASLPSFPFLSTSYMGEDRQCHSEIWSRTTELIYLCVLIIMQLITPLAIATLLFARIYASLRSGRSGDVMLVEDAPPGTEESYQQAVMKRKVFMMICISIVAFTIVAVVSFIELSLALNIDDIESNTRKHARIRELASLFECFKCVFVPLVSLFYYDTLRRQISKSCCCLKNRDAYNSLNLRYNVYQQTVHENAAAPAHDKIEDEEPIETTRDDVGILD